MPPAYLDDALCACYDASLNTVCRALLSEDGPREDFAAYVEWTLVRNGSPLTVSHEDDLARSTPDPEPSPPSPRSAEHQPEPTDDGEPFPAAINEPAQSRATEWKITPEVKPNPSDQVRELVAVPTTREPAVDGVSAEWSSAPCTVAEGELIIHLGLLDMEGDFIDWETELEFELPPLLSPSSPLVPSSPPSSLVPMSSPEGAPEPPVPTPRKCPPVPAPRKCPPSHPLLPPPPLSSGSPPPARPQPLICMVRAPWFCHPPVLLGLEYPSPLPPASEAWTLLRPVDPAAPPRLLAPSPPPSPVDPPGSLFPPAPPWSGVDPPSPRDSSPLAAPRCSIPPAPLGSFLPSAPPGSSVAQPRISALFARALCSTLAPRILGIPLARWLSVSASGSSTTCSAAVGRPPGVSGHPSSMAPPSVGSTVGHHGCGLGPAVRLLLRVPPVSSLAPPSFVAPLDCLPAPSRWFVLLLSHLRNSHPPLPMLLLRCEDAPFGRGHNVRIVDCFVFCSPCVPCDPVSLSLIVNLIPGVSCLPPWLSCL